MPLTVHPLRAHLLSSPPPYRPNLDYFMEELVMANPSEDVQDLLAATAGSDMHGFNDSEGVMHEPESAMMHDGSMSNYTLRCKGKSERLLGRMVKQKRTGKC